MSRRTVDDKEILPYKWKIDEELKVVLPTGPGPDEYSDKSTYKYWSQEANRSFYEGKFNEAIKFFDKSLEIKPNIAACIGKAEVFEELEKYDQAIKCYDDYLESLPDNQYEVAKVCRYEGSLLAQLHRYTEAMQCYEKSEKLGFDSQLDIIGLFGQMGKYSEVIKRSEEIIRSEDRWSSDLSDRKIGAMFFKANALDALGNFDEAIKYYDQVISDLINKCYG